MESALPANKPFVHILLDPVFFKVNELRLVWVYHMGQHHPARVEPMHQSHPHLLLESNRHFPVYLESEG